jgi:glutamine---fructose-6-phosphate transaminase (isomerizing)
MMISPLIGKDSPLDERSQQLLADLIQANNDRARTLPTDNPRDEKRFARVEFTSTEMWKQTEAMLSTLEGEKQLILDIAADLSQRPIHNVYMVGCGDSLYSMLGVRGLLEKILGVSCEPMQALDFAYYYSNQIDEKSVVFTLSSTGKTPRTMEALLVAKSRGARTISLTNTTGTPLMTEADFGLYIHAERKGWPTQSSTSAMAAMIQIGLETGKRRGFSPALLDSYEKEFHRTIDLITPTLQAKDRQMAAIAKDEAGKNLYLFAGGGPAYVCALYGAAKTSELTPTHAYPIMLEEYHHYRSQKTGDPLFLVAPQGPSTLRAKDTGSKGLEVGGLVYAVVTEGDSTLDGCYSQRIDLPRIDEFFVPVLYTLPLQQFAYHVAKEKYRLAGME